MEFETSPALGPAYLRALLDRRPGRMPAGVHAPRLEARLAARAIDRASLDGYRDVCGFEPSEALPITYPHILAAGIQMAMLSDRRFPVRLAGLVHTGHRIAQHRPIGEAGAPALRCWLEGSETTEAGEQFTLHTTAAIDGEVAWEEETVFIARGPSRGRRGTPPPDETVWDNVERWSVPADVGRRYARVSGDYNPIHLWRVTGKLFGFPGAIAHGMWSMARCAARLQAGTAGRLDVRFRRPLVLPATARLQRSSGTNGTGFRLVDEAGSVVYLTGSLGTV